MTSTMPDETPYNSADNSPQPTQRTYNYSPEPSQKQHGTHVNNISPDGTTPYKAEYNPDKSIDINDENSDGILSTVAKANQSMRTASALNAFFLICTDMLGPAQAPYGIATLGYVGGSILYFAMGMFFIYTSMVLLKLYLFYNNDAAPVRTYGELLERVFARYGRRTLLIGKWTTVTLQIFQLWLNGSVAILGSAQALYQVSRNNICFVAFSAIYTAVACCICCIRQLKNLSALSLFAMTANIFICFATIGVAANTGFYGNLDNAAPSSLLQAGYVAVDANGDGLAPASGVAFESAIPLQGVMNGVSTMIYAYAGATVFVEIMAEMKNPRDFKKSFLGGMVVIIVLYLSFGLGLYAIQGPYAGNPANQGLTQLQWQDALNIITVLTLMISGSLYMNVGMKVFYAQVGMDLFHFPALDSRRGQMLWIMLSFSFWWSAFVLAEVIPQFSAFTGIVSSLVMIQFSFTLPPLMHIMHEFKQDNLVADGSDSTASMRTHLFRNLPWKVMDALVVLGSLVLCGMGTWGSIETLLSALNNGSTAIFGCNGP